MFGVMGHEAVNNVFQGQGYAGRYTGLYVMILRKFKYYSRLVGFHWAGLGAAGISLCNGSNVAQWRDLPPQYFLARRS